MKLGFAELVGVIHAIEASHKTAQEREKATQEEKQQSDDNDTSRLAKLFPGLDTHPEIIEIKEMFGRGCIEKKLAPPRFFDGLLYVMEQNWKQCNDVLTIHLELIPGENYEHNIFHLSGVLNELIQHSTLQALTLKEFPPDMVLASLATLTGMHELDYLDLSNNSLDTGGLDSVLYQLPRRPIDPIHANFEHNAITDERLVGLFLRHHHNLKSVKIADQKSGKLDTALIQAKLESNSPIALA